MERSPFIISKHHIDFMNQKPVDHLPISFVWFYINPPYYRFDTFIFYFVNEGWRCFFDFFGLAIFVVGVLNIRITILTSKYELCECVLICSRFRARIRVQLLSVYMLMILIYVWRICVVHKFVLFDVGVFTVRARA